MSATPTLPGDPALHADLQGQLDESVREIFAMMLNLACMPGDAEQPPDPNRLVAYVSFEGALRGFCTLELDRPCASELTANLMGLSIEELDAELLRDTAGELCNMIAGSWKTRQPDEMAAWQLSCPSVTDASQVTEGTFRQVLMRTYQVASRSIVVHLRLI